MNLKSIVMVASAMIAGFSMADEYNSGVKLCRVEVANNTSDAVISVPVLGMATDTDAVSPADLVLTNGMTNGDYMYANVGGIRKAWAFNGTAWEGTAVAVDILATNLPPAIASDAIARGDSIWLHRKSASGPIYLWGRVATNPYEMETAAGFTMIGNPTLDEYSLLEIPWGTTKPAVDDQIMTIDGNNKTTGVGTTYTYHSFGNTTNWVVKTKDEQDHLQIIPLTADTAPKFGPGEGFYYKATGTAPAINWPAPAAN